MHVYVCVRERKGRKHDVVSYLDYALPREAHHRLCCTGSHNT